MRRAKRWCVKYAQAQSDITTRRFRNPIRKKTWMSSQASQASRPESVDAAEVRDAGLAADGRERALVDVAERPPRLAAQRAQHVLGRVLPHLHRRGRDARAPACRPAAARPGRRRSRPRGWPGERQVRLDRHAPRAVDLGAPSARAERRGRDAGGPEHRARVDPLGAELHRRALDAGDRAPRRTSTPSRSSCRCAFAERSGGYGGSTRSAASTSTTRARRRVDAPEVPAQRQARDLGERARQLDAGRARADHDERQPLPARGLVRLALGLLEGEQHAPADLSASSSVFRPGRVRLPVGVAEVRVRRAGGDDERVVGDLAVGQQHACGARGRRRAPRPAAPPCSRRRRMWRMGAAMSARRGRRSRPGRAAAGTGGGCGGRRA